MNNPFDSIDARLSNIESLILDLKHKPVASTEGESKLGDFLTVPQAAEYLSLAVPTIYGLVHRSEIPFMKKGKRLYFSKERLKGWVKSGNQSK